MISPMKAMIAYDMDMTADLSAAREFVAVHHLDLNGISSRASQPASHFQEKYPQPSF